METQKSPPAFWTKKEIRAFKIGRKVLIYAETVTEDNINAIKPKFI